jgi:hypothetical protein
MESPVGEQEELMGREEIGGVNLQPLEIRDVRFQDLLDGVGAKIHDQHFVVSGHGEQ